jgi:hypothetical protein
MAFKDKPRALAFYADCALTNYREPEQQMTAETAVETHLLTRLQDQERGIITERHYNYIAGELKHFTERFGAKSLAQLSAPVIAEYLGRGEKRPALKTSNLRRAVVHTLFAFTMRKEWVAANPLAKVQRHRLEHGGGSAAPPSAEQAAKIMAHLETIEAGAMVPYFALCLFAGIRPSVPDGEISRLPAADVRLDTGNQY